MDVTKQQLAKIHTLLGQIIPDAKERDEYKKHLVQQYTNNRETSSAKLKTAEAAMMIDALEKLAPKNALLESAEKMRKKILFYCHKMQWYVTPGKLDMERINNWCVKYGHGHKRLNDYKQEELPQLVSQMQAVYGSFLKGIHTFTE